MLPRPCQSWQDVRLLLTNDHSILQLHRLCLLNVDLDKVIADQSGHWDSATSPLKLYPPRMKGAWDPL